MSTFERSVAPSTTTGGTFSRVPATKQPTFLEKLTGYAGAGLSFGRQAVSFISNPLGTVARQPAVQKVAKDIARATPRSAASVTLDAAEVVTGQRAQPFTPTGTFERFLFGEEEVQPFQQRAFAWSEKAKELAAKAGIEGPKKQKTIGALGPLGLIAFTVGDLLPVTGPEAAVLKELAALKKVDEIIPILRKLGIAEEAVQDTAKAISRLSRTKDVQKVLRASEEVSGALRTAEKALPGVDDAVRAGDEVASLEASAAARASERAPGVAEDLGRAGDEGKVPIGEAFEDASKRAD
jgi:hypothetical protein